MKKQSREKLPATAPMYKSKPKKIKQATKAKRIAVPFGMLHEITRRMFCDLYYERQRWRCAQ